MRLNLLLRIAALSLAALHLAGAHGQSSEQIVIDGPPLVMPLAAALVKAFQISNPDFGVVFEKDLGSEARMEALLQGKVDIAVATRGLDFAWIARHGLMAHDIARTAVVFAVNAGVPISHLSGQQICDVYGGQIPNWKMLGGPDLAIAPHTRPAGQVEARVVRTAIYCLRRLRLADAVKVIRRPRDMAKALAETPGAIGMTSMSAVEESQGRLRMVTIDGVAPSVDNVERMRYGMVRETLFVTWSPPPPEVERFLRFVRSAEGDQVIRVNGAVPMKERISGAKAE